MDEGKRDFIRENTIMNIQIKEIKKPEIDFLKEKTGRKDLTPSELILWIIGDWVTFHESRRNE
jgi:hypothetical protein